MKTFKIIIEIEHTDRTFESPEVQQFIQFISQPSSDFKKTMLKTFKKTALGAKAFNISVTYGLLQ
jgi:hypothetical protein